MRLSTWLNDMDRVISECLIGGLYTGGEVVLGQSLSFYASLGGRQKPPGGGVNGTREDGGLVAV